MDKYDNGRGTAKSLLIHYIKMCMQGCGEYWTGDNMSEIEHCVDCIVDAAKNELRQEFEDRFKQLEGQVLHFGNTASCLANGIIPD